MSILVHYWANHPGATLEHTSITEDLGIGGAFLRTAHPPPQGTSLLLRLQLPSCWSPLILEGEVRWVRERGQPQGCGVAFNLEPGEAARALSAFLEDAMF